MENSGTRERAVRFGIFEADLRAGELRRQGLKVKLHGKPIQILALLLERPGEAVTREELRERLWPADTFVDFDHGLNNAVNKLREALGDSAETPRYVETLPRIGYRFIAPVALPVAPASSGPETALDKSSGRPSKRRLGLALAVVVLLVVVIAIGWQQLQRPPAVRADKVRLAVLPFQNLSDDPEQEYFSDGLTLELISALGRLEPNRLGVIGATSAMSYKGTPAAVERMRDELGVDYVLEGSVRREADRVRIAAQLVQMSDRTQLWSQTYDRELADIFSIQEDVASRVASSLAIELLQPQNQYPSPPAATTPEAYEAFLKGHYFTRHGNANKAAAFYVVATEIDPNYGPAYAGLANSLVFMYPQTMPKARQVALRALELDPLLPSAHSALGLVRLMHEWDWEGAEASFQRALSLDPAKPETHLRYSNYLAAMGRVEEAIAEARRAQQLDPRAPLPGQTMGRYYMFLGQTDRAIEEFKKALELDPDFLWSHIFLSIAYEQKAMYDQWADYGTRAWALTGGNSESIAEFKRIYAEQGYEAAARYRLGGRERRARRGHIQSAAIALGYVELGEKEKALYWLEQAFAHHTRDLIYLQVEPQYEPIREYPRFQAMLRRMNFPPPAGGVDAGGVED